MRLIDADALENQFGVSDEDLLALDEIRHAPTVDAVPVVRCKDCKYRDGTPGQPNILCAQMHEDDFCSYGKRKEEPHDRLQKGL
jgi:hypothetical protein